MRSYKLNRGKVNKLVLFFLMFFIAPVMGDASGSLGYSDGDELSITLSLDEEHLGTRYLQGTIEYDATIFGSLSETQISLSSGWGSLILNEDTGVFIIERTNHNIDDVDVLTVHFIVEDGKDSLTDLSFADVKVLDKSNKLVELEDQSYSFEVLNLQEVSETEIDSDELSEVLGVDSTDETESEFKIGYQTLILGATALLSVGFVLFLRFRFGVPVEFAVLSSSVLFAAGNVTTVLSIQEQRRDVDGNGIVDSADIEALKQYLIGMYTADESSSSETEDENTQDSLVTEYEPDFDINGDGQVDLEDLVIILPDEEYEPIITTLNDFSYFTKEEQIDYAFKVEDFKQGHVHAVIVEGKEVVVAYNAFTDTYIATLDAHNVSGLFELSIEGIVSKSGESYDLTETYTYEVLKSEPVIKNLNILEVEGESKVRISFDLSDDDHALIGDTYFTLSNDFEVVLKQMIKEGHNEVIVDIEMDLPYVFELIGQFDLDSNKFNSTVENEGSLYIIKDVLIKEDDAYTYSFNGIELLNEFHEPITFVERNHTFILALDIEADTELIEHVVLNDEVHQVFVDDGGNYYVKLEGYEATETQTFEVSGLVLKTGKVLEVSENNQISIDFIKRKPSIVDLKLKEHGDALIVSYNLQDEDHAISQLTAVIKDTEGDVIYKGVLTNELSVNIADLYVSGFVVEVYADYELSEEVVATSALMVSLNQQAVTKYTLKDAYLTSDTLQKGETIEVFYEFYSNNVADVSYVSVSGRKVPVVKVEDNLYKVSVNSLSVAGLHELQLKGLFLENGETIELVNQLDYQILKDKPYVDQDSVEIVTSLEQGKPVFKFDLIDVDKSSVEQTVKLYHENDLIAEFEAVSGINEIVMDLEDGIAYNIQIFSSYTVDFIDQTLIENQRLANFYVTLKDDYNVTLTQLETYLENSPRYYFEKDSEVTLRFESDNAVGFDVLEVKINDKFYDVSKVDGKYHVNYPVGHVTGENELKISELKLENYYIAKVDEIVTIEVLKDKPTIQSVKKRVENNDVVVSFDLVDEEHTVQRLSVEVLDEQQNVIESVLKDERVIFTPNSSEQYTINFIASYDLDQDLTNGLNNVENEIIHAEKITHTTELLQLRNIEDITLYYNDGKTVEEVSTIDFYNLDVTKYLVKVASTTVPDMYLNLLDVVVENDEIYLVLDLDRSVSYINEVRVEGTKVLYDPTNTQSLTKDATDEFHSFNLFGWNPLNWRIEEDNSEMNTLNENQSRLIVQNELSHLDNYDEKRQLAYQNMLKLTPYYESSYIISMANDLEVTNILNQKQIETIYPLDEENQIVYGLNSETLNKITSLKIMFADQTTTMYDITYTKTFEGIAIYDFNELPIRYHFETQVLDMKQSLIGDILEEVKSLSLEKIFTNEFDEANLLRDYYVLEVEPVIEQFVLSVLESTPKYLLIEQTPNKAEFVKTALFSDKELEQLIYTLNYFDRFYGVEMGMTKLSNMLTLGGETYYHNDMSLENLMSSTMESAHTATGQSVEFYNEILKPLLNNQTMAEFLNGEILTLTSYENSDDWFTEEIGSKLGQFKEVSMQDFEDVQYRAWTLLSRREDLILPLVSAKEEVLNELYLLAQPAQIVVGSMNNYEEQESFSDLIHETTGKMINFYQVIAHSLDDVNTSLFAKTSVYFDSTKDLVVSDSKNEDPILKWLYSEWNACATQTDVDAYSQQNNVYFVDEKMMGSTTSHIIYTHHAAHLSDEEYFYQGNDRRAGTFEDEHSDGNLTQKLFSTYTFNLSEDFDTTNSMFANFTLDRIDTRAELQDYYHDAFDTLYVIDYLVGKAFLNLTSQQQANVATQIFELGTSSTYSQVTPHVIDQMNLTTVYDLVDNKLSLQRPQTVGVNQGMLPNYLNISWYNPSNKEGRIDEVTFKELGFEFLGEAGYLDGYVTYMSSLSNNDLEALRNIMNDETITYETYTKQRFEEAQTFINSANHSYFDSDSLIELFEEALKSNDLERVETLKQITYGVVKRATNDFTTGTIYELEESIEISTAQEFIDVLTSNDTKMGTYEIVSDLDFSKISTSNQAYVMDTFVGYIKGNDHVIKGISVPLFNEMHYSYVTELSFEDVKADQSGALIANTSYYSGYENMSAYQVNNKTSFVGEFIDSIELGENTLHVQRNTNEIYTVEEFLNMKMDEEYTLMAHLDFSDVPQHVPIINKTFKGVLNGNEYTISNLRQPLFDELEGTVKNISLEKVNINAFKYDVVGALARTAKEAIILDVRGEDISISNAHDKVGSLIGESHRTIFDNIDIIDIDIYATGEELGGLVGRALSSAISNVYVEGEITFIGHSSGGIVGTLQNDSTLFYSVSNVDMTRLMTSQSDDYNGGLVGKINLNDGILANSIALGNASEGVYKAIYPLELNSQTAHQISNIYEILEGTGKTSVGFNSPILSISKTDANKNFYVGTLGFLESIWSFEGEVPRLK